MERKKIEIEVGTEKEVDLEAPCYVPTIDEIVDFLTASRKDGATHIQFSGIAYDNLVGDIGIQPVKYELESDEKFSRRKTRVKEQAKMDEEYERKQLTELLKKYPQNK